MKGFTEKFWLICIDTSGPNSSIHTLLKCSNEITRKSQFGLILSNLDNFLLYADPSKAIDYFRAFPIYDDVVRRLTAGMEGIDQVDHEDTDDLEMTRERELKKKKLILRSIPNLGTFAALDLLHTIYENPSSNRNEEARHFVDSLFNLRDGEFPNHFKSVKEEQAIIVCDIGDLASEMMMHLGLDDLPSGLRPVNYRFDRVVNYSTHRLVNASVNPSIQMENPIILRNYQEELCRLALRGINTIITAPTGTGKTVVAANIIKNHFESRIENEQNFKALFMAPTTAILQQQADRLKTFLGHAYNIKVCQGADNSPTRQAVLSNDIIVATPQIIVNLCNEHKDELSEFSDEKFCLSTFSIIVFDECHSSNITSESSYSNIMREYHTLKNMGIVPVDHQLPQIIGLTASLGTGNAKDSSSVIDHIAGMCASLDVEKMSTVQDYAEELQRFSPVIPERIDVYEKSSAGSSGEFSTSIKLMMDKMMRLMEDAFENRDEYLRVSLSEKAPSKEHSGYLNWLCSLKRNVAEAHIRGNRKNINESLNMLENLYRSLCFNCNFNPKTAWKYLEEKIKERERYVSDQMRTVLEEHSSRLAQLSEDVSSENQMILRVEELLIQNNEENQNSRTIIFVQTRYEAVTLTSILNEKQSLQNQNINSDFIFGLNKTTEGSEDSAISRLEQLEKLKQFSNGNIRVLVSTSVAEEGLDVSECNLVIKYNYATNVIAHVQRRGRGRASDSKSILITNDENLKKQENTNKDKERMSVIALKRMQDELSLFKCLVNAKRNAIWPQIQNEHTEKVRKDRELIAKNSTYRIVCRNCDEQLCTSRDIRSRKDDDYLVCDPEFWKLVRTIPDYGDYSNGTITHAVGDCGVKLGKLISASSFSEMPTLAAKCIILIDDANGERQKPTKWKQISSKLFKPERITPLDVERMRNARSATIALEVHQPDGRVETVTVPRPIINNNE